MGQALLDASRAWAGFDGRHARSWLIRILRNGHLQACRRRESVAVDLDPDLLGDEPWNAIDWRLVGPDLLARLDRLPEECRLAVALCDVEEMPYQEAAEAMDCSVGAVKSRVFRGRRMLRASLAQFEKELG